MSKLPTNTLALLSNVIDDPIELMTSATKGYWVGKKTIYSH